MQVRVRYMGQLKTAAGTATDNVELAEPCTVRGLRDALAERHGDPLRGLLPAALVFINDDQAADDTELRDGEAVTLLSPIAGG